MRFLLSICFCMLLAACDTPFTSAANMALSSVTYFFTGKTTTDHGLSFVMQEDCEMIRALESQSEICRPVDSGYEEAPTDVALSPLEASPELARAEFRRADGSLAFERDDPQARQTARIPLGLEPLLSEPGQLDALQSDAFTPVSDFFDFR